MDDCEVIKKLFEVLRQERGNAILTSLEQFTGPCAPDAVRWVDAGTQLQLVEAPLDIAVSMRARLHGALAMGDSAEAGSSPPEGTRAFHIRLPGHGQPAARVVTT